MSTHRTCCCGGTTPCGTCICTGTPFGRIRWTGSVSILDDECNCPLLTTPFMSSGTRMKDFVVSDGLLRLTAINLGCCGRSTGPYLLGSTTFAAYYSASSPCTAQACPSFACGGFWDLEYLVHYPSSLQQYWEVRVSIGEWGKGYLTPAPQNQPATHRLQLVYRKAYENTCVPPTQLDYYGATYEVIGGTAAINDCLYAIPYNYVGKLGVIVPGVVELT